jgi:hypothetical protein
MNNVNTIYSQDDLLSTMPKADDIDYRFSFRPISPPPDLPLLSDDELRHMFDHPAGSIYHDGVYDSECRNRLPKRRWPLQYFPNQGYPIGWGIEFIEGFNWSLLFYSEVFIFFVTISFTVLWSVFARANDKVPTAFTIGQWMFGVGQVLYIVYVVVSEALMFWKY